MTSDRTPWFTGIAVSVFAAMLSTSAVAAFCIALGDVNVLLAVVVNLIAVGGLAPTVWRWRAIPV